MTSKTEKLEKLMADAEGLWDWEHEAQVYFEALRNCAPLLLEIVKAAENYKKEQEEIMSCSSQRTLSPAELALYEALAAFKGE